MFMLKYRNLDTGDVPTVYKAGEHLGAAASCLFVLGFRNLAFTLR